jgi:hypothetical protein
VIDIRIDLRQFQITRSLNNPYASSLWTTIAANCSMRVHEPVERGGQCELLIDRGGCA